MTAWRIWVSGYGEFDFEGTEAEAEEMRLHKKDWEGAMNAYKWRTNLSRESDQLTAKCVQKWANGEGVPQSWMSRRRMCLEKEARDAVA